MVRERLSILVKNSCAAATAKHASEVARARKLDQNAGFGSMGVASKRSLEVVTEAYTKLDAKHTTAKYFAAALAGSFLTAKRALKMAAEGRIQECTGGADATVWEA